MYIVKEREGEANRHKFILDFLSNSLPPSSPTPPVSPLSNSTLPRPPKGVMSTSDSNFGQPFKQVSSPLSSSSSSSSSSPSRSPLPSNESHVTHRKSRSRSKKSSSTSPQQDSLAYALTSGLAGGIAGCIAKTSVAPLDRVKILFQTRSPDYQRYAGTWLGVFRASRDIYKETGLRGLLQGHSATLIRIFPYAAIKFMAYEQFHSLLMPDSKSEDSLKRFIAGSLAGITTTGITYPLELIRVRLAFEPHHSKKDKASLSRTIRQIYYQSSTTTSSLVPPPPSPSGGGKPPNIGSSSSSASTRQDVVKPSMTHFYRGVFPTLAGIIPYAGTSFLVWGYLKQDLFPKLFPRKDSNNRAALDLLAGGLAGAIGQTTAYPLDIVRRRMQVGPISSNRQQEFGFWETGSRIFKTQGWRGFFVGLSIGYLKVVPMNAVSFSSWVFMKRFLGLDDDQEQENGKKD